MREPSLRQAPRAAQPARDLPTQREPQPARDVPTQRAPTARDFSAARDLPTQPARPAARAARPPAGVASSAPVDPLAELARLIGEQDPFVDFADLQPDPATSRAPAAPVQADARTAARQAARGADPRIADDEELEPRRPDPRRLDPRLARRQPDAAGFPADGATAAPRAPARPAAPRQTIARVGQEQTQVRAPASDPLTARRPAADGATRRADAAFGEADYPDPSRRPPPRPAAAPDLPQRQASLAAPPQRAALLPPRGDGEPVDRSATSVRLGYGSLAHQAQVPPTGRQRPDPRAVPDEDEYFEEQAPRAPAADPRRAQPQQPQPQEASAAYAYSAPRRAEAEEDEATYVEGYDPQYEDDGYMPAHGDEVYDGEARRRKGRSALMLVASVLGIVIAGTAGVFAYRMAVHGTATTASGGPPVIRADTAPSKIISPPSSTPQDAQQKLIYDRVGGTASGNEKMLPREEQPVDVTAAAIRSGTPAATDPVINSLATEPKRVRTLTVRSDGSIVSDGAAAAPAPTAGPSAGVQALQAYAASQMPGAPPAMVNLPAAGSGKIDAPPVARSGDYVVQVASQRSEADAMGSWKALQTRYPNLLSSYVASVKKADLGDRGIYYRAQVGPFASKDQANDLCQALRAQGGDCMVTKN